MALNVETRRCGQAPAGPLKVFCSRNASENSLSTLDRQAASVARRFAVSNALARAIAEHAFAKGVQR